MKKLLLFTIVILITCLACTESSSDQYWAKTYGSGSASLMLEISDSGYFLARTNIIDANNCDIVLMKLNSSGNISWQKTYDINERDNHTSIAETMDGGCIIAGATCSGPVGDSNCHALV